MWIRKSESELKEPIKRYRFLLFFDKLEQNPFLGAILIFLFMFFFSMFAELFIGVSHGRYSGIPMDPAIKFNELPQRLPYYFKISIGSAIITFIVGYFLRKKTQDKKMEFVCDKCNKLIEDNKSIFCECGGEYVHSDKMKWIEDE